MNQLDAVQRTIDSSINVIQRVRTEDGGKRKGEDYCNNIGKLITNIDAALPGFSNSAIATAIATINENRVRCTVATSLVEGPDTNTAAYSEFVTGLNDITGRISLLKLESNFGYAQREVKSFGKDLMALLDTIPTVAVDDRVETALMGSKAGDAAAAAASAVIPVIKAALIALKEALKARFKEFITALLEEVKLRAAAEKAKALADAEKAKATAPAAAAAK